MSGKLPPLNVVYWSGESVGKENEAYAKMIRQMLGYASSHDFVTIFRNRDGAVRNSRAEPDVIILSEIFPHGVKLDFDQLVPPGFKAMLQSMGGADKEHMLVAYNKKTVSRVNTKPTSTEIPFRASVEITVQMAHSNSTPRNSPYKIIALHLTNRNKAAELENVFTHVARSNLQGFGKSPHLLIGDTNYDVDEETADMSKFNNTSDGQEFHWNFWELNPDQEFTIKNRQFCTIDKATKKPSNRRVDRSWYNGNLVNAEIRYFRMSASEKIKTFNNNLLTKLGLPAGDLSQHPLMAVRLTPSKNDEEISLRVSERFFGQEIRFLENKNLQTDLFVGAGFRKNFSAYMDRFFYAWNKLQSLPRNLLPTKTFNKLLQLHDLMLKLKRESPENYPALENNSNWQAAQQLAQELNENRLADNGSIRG